MTETNTMTEIVRDRGTGIDKYKNGERDNLPDKLEMHDGRVHTGGVGSGPVLVQVHAQHVGLQFRLRRKGIYCTFPSSPPTPLLPSPALLSLIFPPGVRRCGENGASLQPKKMQF